MFQGLVRHHRQGGGHEQQHRAEVCAGVGGTRAHRHGAHQHYHAGRAQAKRKSALHDPADPVFHRGILSAADGCCGQSKGTAASGKTHGADQRVKQQICFSASCCCDRKNRGTHRCEARYSSGAARACGPAAPMNCVNPSLAGSRSSSAVILLPRFSPPQI